MFIVRTYITYTYIIKNESISIICDLIIIIMSVGYIYEIFNWHDKLENIVFVSSHYHFGLSTYLKNIAQYLPIFCWQVKQGPWSL
jgi:arginine exporter protein ArgO